MGLNQTATVLNSFGFTNCTAWNDNVAAVFKITSILGNAAQLVSIPNTNAFHGLNIYSHWAHFDSTQPGGVTFTNYVRAVVGGSNP